mgnify:CR=1 FL=1
MRDLVYWNYSKLCELSSVNWLIQDCLQKFLLSEILSFFLRRCYSSHSRRLFRYYTVIRRIVQHQTYTFIIIIGKLRKEED